MINNPISFSSNTKDGRVNSSLDEESIIMTLISRFGERVKPSSPRMWYDMKVYDYKYGWLPVNIKTTTMSSSDNAGNLAMCLYAYTSEEMELDKSYTNGDVFEKLVQCFDSKKYNRLDKRDYYFLVLNKNRQDDIVINSLKGLSKLTPNINNLPFQIKWNDNRIFNYGNISQKLKLFFSCVRRTNDSWTQKFVPMLSKFDI